MIGGGVGGLSCARRLAQHGIETDPARGRHGRGRRERAERRLPASPGIALFHNDARERLGIERARGDVRGHARGAAGGDRARGGARRGRRAPPDRAAAAGGVRGGGRARPRPRGRAPRGRLPRRDGRARGPAARAPADGSRGLPDRPRLRAPPRALVPAAGGCRRAGRCADPRGIARGADPSPRPARARSRPTGGVCPRDARRGGRRRRASRARSRVRRAACGRGGSTWSPPSRFRRRWTRWSTRAGATSTSSSAPTGASSRAASATWTPTSSYTDSDAGSPLIWDRVEALPARGPRRGAAASATAGRAWSATATTRSPTSARCPAAPGLYVSGGYSGVGNVPGFMCGRDIADAIAGEGRDPLFPADREPWTDPAAASLIGDLLRAGARALRAAHARLEGSLQARAGRAGGRRDVLVPRSDPWPVYIDRGEGARIWDVDGNEYARLPQRLQRDGPGPRSPGDRRGRPGARRARHPLRRHDRARGGGRRGADPALRAPALALHQLRHRVEHGRDQARAARPPAASGVSSGCAGGPTTAHARPRRLARGAVQTTPRALEPRIERDAAAPPC